MGYGIVDALHTLQWLYQMGVDECIADSPVNHFKSIHTNPPKKTSVLGSNESIKIAKQVAQNITDLNSLQHALETFTGCPSLKNTAKHTLTYTGNPNPIILCIGDCPTEQDEHNGKLLNGQHRTILQRILKSIGIGENDFGYTNRSFWYAPGGRTVTTGEAQTCLPFVNKIIQITKPKYLLILGNDTAKTILNTPDNMAKINGKPISITIAGTDYTCMPIFGFKSIFDNPKRKQSIWHAIQNIQL